MALLVAGFVPGVVFLGPFSVMCFYQADLVTDSKTGQMLWLNPRNHRWSLCIWCGNLVQFQIQFSGCRKVWPHDTDLSGCHEVDRGIASNSRKPIRNPRDVRNSVKTSKMCLCLASTVWSTRNPRRSLPCKKLATRLCSSISASKRYVSPPQLRSLMYITLPL